MKALAAGLILASATACGGENRPTLAERGEELRASKGCVNCHSTDGSDSTGPTWKGLYGSRVRLSDETTVVADDAYMADSMRRPSAQTVRGYREGLMETVIKPGALSDDEVRALVAYIKTLK
ncbi:MAG: c-type cytochrome [Actinomycetota bacterium]